MSKSNKSAADRIAKHPMYSPSDLKYLRGKGYSDAEILAFWDRDHGLGCKPVQHRFTYTGSPREVVQEVMRDNLSPQAVAAIVAYLQPAGTNNSDVDRQVRWFAEELVKFLGGDEQQSRLADELGL